MHYPEIVGIMGYTLIHETVPTLKDLKPPRRKSYKHVLSHKGKFDGFSEEEQQAFGRPWSQRLSQGCIPLWDSLKYIS